MNSDKKLWTENIKEIYDGKPVPNPFFLPQADEFRGFAWNETDEPTISSDSESELIKRSSDAIYNISYKEPPLSQLISKPHNIVNHRIREYLTTNLGNLWNIDAGPFSHIVASYMDSTVWTHYLDWAYNWRKQGQDIKILDLILEYTFEENEITLLKLPSHIAVEQDDWKVTPIIDANGLSIDPANFTKREPLLIMAVPYTQLSTRQQMMKRIGPNEMITSSTPKIFYSSASSRGKLIVPSDKQMTVVRSSWMYSTLDKIIMSNGIVGTTKLIHNSSTYEPDLEVFTYCQLCDEETTACSVCKFRDLLFCHTHSGIIKEGANSRPYCRKCLSDPLVHGFYQTIVDSMV